jgi:hypothetical protein
MSTTEIKKPVERSSAYPSYTILFCVELVKNIVSKFGSNNYATREDIAKVLNVSAGYLATQIGASVHYGLLEVKVKVGYKPTELFKRITKFLSESEKQEALNEALRLPELYSKLLNEIEDQVPAVNALAIRLNRYHNITDAASEKAARVFIENLNDLGLVRSDGTFETGKVIVEVPNEELPINPAEIVEPEARKALPPSAITILPSPNHLTLEIPLRDQRIAKLIYPSDISDNDLNKIVRFVDALRE